METQTKKNLSQAFAGESQANRRYLAFAEKAQEEGLPGVARLFRAVAQSETIHALNHLKAAGVVKTTAENLAQAIEGEKSEYTGMYPMFMDQARRDADSDALNSFFWANEAEQTHDEFYVKALEAAKQGKDIELGELYICKVCGYTVEGNPPDVCPVCKKGKEFFIKAD